MAGTPVEISDNKLVLAFQNNFNKDKLFVPELLAQVEEAIEANCHLKVKLVGRVDPSQFKTDDNSATPREPAANEISPVTTQNANSGDLLESALNVFGGEVVK
jgi:hypothetical protein